jgi:hypothetical protein
MALTLNNDIDNLKVGDYFWCYFNAIDMNFTSIYSKDASGDNRNALAYSISDIATKLDYEVSGKELNPSLWSKETSGYFKFIVVDVKPNGDIICISDRNVAYFAAFSDYEWNDSVMQIGVGLEKFTFKPMSNNLAVGGNALASSQAGTGTTASNAFDTNYLNYWQPVSTPNQVSFSDEWIGYEFVEPVLIHYVGWSSTNTMYGTLGIPSLYLEYSDDGLNWTKLSTFDLTTCNWYSSGVETLQLYEFQHNHTTKHKYWRVRFEKGTSSSVLRICTVKMYEKMSTNEAVFSNYIPIITAPTSNWKKEERVIELSDWDKYINSDLGGLLPTVGDNNIWNLKYPSYTNAKASATYDVVIRGGNNGDASYFNTISMSSRYTENVTSGAGFRPKLILKRKDFVDSVKFFKNNGQFKTYDTGREAEFKSVPHIPEFVDDASTTSSTQNGYSISANTGTAVWKLLNRSSDSWLSSDMVTTAEIVIDFGVLNDKRVGGYVIEYNFGNGYDYGNSTFQDIYASPRDWDVYGSTSGSAWTLVDSRRGEIFNQGELKKFYFDKAHTYRFFKFVFLANNGDPKNIAIKYINLYDNHFDKVKPYWQSLSTTMPSQSTIRDEGLKDLSVLDRKIKKFTESVKLSSSFGSGNLYKGKIKLSTLKNIGGFRLV